jgi:hypothetical protein
LLIERNAIDLWETEAHWKLAEHTDMLNRRILLVRNRDFNDHHDASYELMLTKECEKAERDREERERMKRQKQEEELSELVHCNASAFVPYGKIGDFDVEDEDENLDEIDETQPQVISEQGIGDLASTDNADSVTANKTNHSLEGAALNVIIEDDYCDFCVGTALDAYFCVGTALDALEEAEMQEAYNAALGASSRPLLLFLIDAGH